MNLLCKTVKFCSLQGTNVQFFLIFTNNEGKIFFILPITRGRGGGGAHVYLVSTGSWPPRPKYVPVNWAKGKYSHSIQFKVVITSPTYVTLSLYALTSPAYVTLSLCALTSPAYVTSPHM